MKKPLNIVINDEGRFQETKLSLYEFLENLNLNFIQIKDSKQFEILINHLPYDLEIFIWVHPNAGEKETTNSPTSGEASALALKALGNINFNLLSRYPNRIDRHFLEQIDKIPINVTELSTFIEKTKAQTVGTICEVASKPASPFHNIREKIDIAIITALYDSEFAMLEQFIENPVSVDGYDTLKICNLKGSSKKVLIDFQTQMGMVNSAILSTRIINDFNVKYMILCGVCGGRESKNVKILDLIIPDKIFEYHSGKYENGIIKPYLRIVNINNSIVVSVKDKIINSMKQSVDSPFNEIFENINIHTKTLACGNWVVKTDEYIEEISKRDEEVVGLEMESYGVARVAETLSFKGVRTIIIKSVMDLTDSTKSDDRKKYAGYVSACFTYFLAKDYL